MTCSNCCLAASRFGKDRKGFQRFRCPKCRRTFTEPHNGTVHGTYATMQKAETIIRLLVEGNSIRSVERITGTHRDTILRILAIVGNRCEQFLERRVRGLAVSDVQCDELWGYIGCKEKHKYPDHPATFGDAYCFVAVERNTKLVLAWHLGRRTTKDTEAFTEKVSAATVGRFQITTDGFPAYPDAVSMSLGTRVDYAQLIKVYGEPRDGEAHYSPAEVVDVVAVPRIGRPKPQRICTSHIERLNLSFRMSLRRLTRLTNAFSKKWENLKAAIALFVAYYNFCRVHKTLRVTPAMQTGIEDHVWSIGELLEATQS